MSKHSSRKCSLAIESAIDETPNNPLNAFLVYNNSTNSSAMASSDSISPLTPPVSRKNEGGYTSSSSSTSPIIVKCSSLPNLSDMKPATMFGNRRISICDLNNFNGELYQAKHDNFMYSNLSTSDISKQPRNFIHHSKTVSGLINHTDQHDMLSPIHFDERLTHFQFRNHKRRHSVALKFEEPKIL